MSKCYFVEGNEMKREKALNVIHNTLTDLIRFAKKMKNYLFHAIVKIKRKCLESVVSLMRTLE